MKGITVSINKKSKLRSGKKVSFSAQAFLDSAGVARKIKEFKRGEIVYSQGDAAKSVLYLQEGSVQLSVVNEAGKEAVVAILGPLHQFHAGAEHSNRGGLDRSAVQLEREAARPHSAIACPLRQGRQASRITTQSIARNAGRDGRYNALAGEFFHEQVQEARLHQVQRRSADQHFSIERSAARLTQATMHST